MKNYKLTFIASNIGAVIQAIITNFAPLLFVTFNTKFNIPYDKITLLITINFIVQLITDLVAVKLVDKIGYRISVILANLFSFVGLCLLGFLPDLIDPFIGLMIATIIYAIGGGLLEVILSPIVEAIPSKNKTQDMSMLHSFFSWGSLAVIILSSLFFYFIGIEYYYILSIIWAILPFINILLFIKAPIEKLVKDEEKLPLINLLKNKYFYVFLIIMLCAGASEQAISQWASTFAQNALHIDKLYGDLFGPAFFALCMGTTRFLFGKFGEKINIDKVLFVSTILCLISYIMISIIPNNIISLIGCGLCGVSVALMWPGTLSNASKTIIRGGTSLFAFLALAGDVGCALGPTLVGLVSSSNNDNLKIGIMVSIIIPITLLISLVVLIFMKRKAKNINRE